MPKKSVRAHGSQAGQQSNTELYKTTWIRRRYTDSINYIT